MRSVYRLSNIVSVIVAVVILSLSGVSGVFAADSRAEVWPVIPPPSNPTCGTAVVDGDISEWDLDNDFFADMYRAGDPSKPVESKIYLRFDSAADTLYVLVLAVPGVDILVMPDDAFVKLGTAFKLVDGNSGDDSVPPDFAWVGLNGNRAQGWEASAKFIQGTFNNFNVHTQVWDDGEAQTSAVKNRAISLTIDCEIVILFPPVAEDDSATTRQDTPVVIPVLNNDVDSDGVIAPTTVSIVTNPTYGSVVVDTVTGEVTYTPDSGFSGDDSFTYQVCDNDGLCDTAVVVVHVIAPAIDVEITVTPGTIHQGDQVTWDIVVTNIGDDPLTNVTLTDSNGHPYGAAFDLAVGESQTFGYTGNPAADVINTVTATGTDPLGADVTDTDSASVNVVASAIDVEITVTPETIHQGDQVTWDVVVTNTGDDPLTNVTLTDSNGHPYGAAFDLAVGESQTFSYTGNPAVDVTNTVTAMGTDPLGAGVTDTDSASVNVVASAIDVEITVTPGTIHQGDQVTWDIVVTNTGDDPLTNVTLTDSNGHPYGAAFDLAVGESQTFSYTGNPAADVINTVTATGTDSLGANVTDTDSASVNVINPAIDVEITVMPETIHRGDQVTWTVVVRNTGDDPLTNVTLTSPNGQTYGTPFSLAVGESRTFTRRDNPTADVTNTITATGTDSLGANVTDTDSASVNVINPAIDVEITVTPETIHRGDQVTWTVVVRNTGDDPLTNVTLTSPNGQTYGTPFSLAVGDSRTFTRKNNPTADVTNTVTATGTDSLGANVTDTDSASVNVINPAIDVEITVMPETIHRGDQVTWTVVVRNTGDDPLTNVRLTSPNGQSYGTPFSLAVGESRTFTRRDNPTADVTNTITATGTDSLGANVTDTDSASVNVINPAIDVEITVTPVTVRRGSQVTWSVVVRNTGDDPLTNVTLTDTNGHSYGAAFSLAVGASRTFSYTGNPTADVTNTVTAMGRDSLNGSVTDTDSASVNVINPAIDVEITVTPETVHQGDQVTWSVVVKNTGDDPLTNVTLTDTNGHSYGAAFSLAVGASRTFSYTSNPMADVTNTVTATGRDSLNGNVTDTDSAAVNVIAPAIEIVKQWVLYGEIPVLYEGGEAFFEILVRNSGDVPLTNVNVSDVLAPDCDRTLGDFAVGAEVTYSCSLLNVQTSFTNTAVGVGTDPLGSPVSDEGEVYVEVVPRNPAISIEKTLLFNEGQVLYIGDDADFLIIVQNIGDMPLYGVMVTDVLVGNCDRDLGMLMVGGSTSYICTAYDVTESFTNTAGVAGADVTGEVVTATDDAEVIVVPFNPTIEVVKNVNAPAGTVFYPGDDVHFIITVTNSGNVLLDTVGVVDALVPGCDQYIGYLTVGETTSYECVAENVQQGFVNVAVVTGSDLRGGTVTDSDDALVVIVGEYDEGDGDGNGNPGYQDPDSDGDGIPDSEEGSGDTDRDGVPNYQDSDSDGDGIPDNVEGVGDTDRDGVPDYQDPDVDGDGIPDSIEGAGDTDGDGRPDFQDVDADGDGIPDADEGAGDTDGDGTPDFQDRDADGDGIPDAVEGAGDMDGDGTPDFQDSDADGDGILDADEGSGDTDNDGTPDYLDQDSDGDGISDVTEGDGDTDGDGIPDFQDGDADGDGIADVLEGGDDTDGDGTPDYLDLDSDADGISDETEGVGDTDGDGIPDFQDLDTDGDGIPDAVEGDADVDGDGTPNFQDLDSDGDGIPGMIEGVVDSDGDGIPNYLDSDSDNDGIPDASEGQADTDGDGIPNYLDLDSDGDGILDSVENIGDANADGTPDPNADGDGTPNYLDLDSDADGVPDALEGTGDVDEDGIPNYLDPDDQVNVDEMPYHVYIPMVVLESQMP